MRKNQKLVLGKFTLRTLTPREAAEVVGGRIAQATIISCITTCITQVSCD